MFQRVARRLAPLLMIGLGSVALSAAPAAGHEPAQALVDEPARALADAEVADALGGSAGTVTRLANGLYEVELRTGPPLTTHGVDGPAASRPLTDAGGRAPRCANSLHQHVFYGRPAGSPDRLASARPVIEDALWRMNAELNRAAVESGGKHADYRVRCDADGRVLVSSFVNRGGPSFAEVVDAARRAGATDPGADYTIFYDDATPEGCGVASYTSDERPSADNRNNSGGGYAVAYSDCWDAATVMHENGHNQGAVQHDSPHSTGDGGHCTDEADVMCYSDGGSHDTGTIRRCDGGERFDCGYDDYFDTAPEPGEYLETHWNLGSAANRFVEFSPSVPGSEPADATSACTSTWSGSSGGRALAADAPTCDRARPTPIRIGARLTYRDGAVRLGLACPATREESCRGRLSVRMSGTGEAGRRFYRLAAGASGGVTVRLARAARLALRRDRSRRVRVLASDRPVRGSAVRTLRLRSGG